MLLFGFGCHLKTIMSSLKQSQVGVSVEEVVFLHQDCKLLLLLDGEVSNGFQVTLLKVLFVKLIQDEIFLLELSEAKHKHFQVLFYLFNSLTLNLFCNPLNITEMALSDTFDESLILFHVPINEPCRCELTEPFLVLFGHWFIRVL